MKLLLLKIFGGFVLVSTAVIGVAIYTSNETESIQWSITSMEITDYNFKGIEFEVELTASIPSHVKWAYTSIEKVVGSFKLAEEYPIRFESQGMIDISEQSTITLYPVYLLYVESAKGSWSALKEAWNKETNTTSVKGDIDITFHRRIPGIGSQQHHFTFIDKDVKVTGVQEMKTVVAVIDDFWSQVSESEGVQSLAEQWNGFVNSEQFQNILSEVSNKVNDFLEHWGLKKK